MTRVLREFCQLVEAEGLGDRTDRELLKRFARKRDEAAFALLVRRPGGVPIPPLARFSHLAALACAGPF
jgi:hypothetical protein